MAGRLLVCCLALAGIVCSADGAPPGELRRVSRASTAASWLRLLAEYSRSAGGAAADDGGDWFPRPVPLSLPLGGAGGAALPVLLLPVPVPAPAQCGGERRTSDPEPPPPSRPVAPAAPDPDRAGPARGKSQKIAPPPPPFDPLARGDDEPAVPSLDDIVSSQQLVEMFRAQAAPEPALPPVLIPDYTAGEEVPAPAAAEAHEGYPAPDAGLSGAARPFRRTRQVYIPRHQAGAAFAAGAAGELPAPPPPRFDRALLLRAELSVPRSGYIEPYTVWWEPRYGAARADLHGGATSAYRLPLPDGRVQSISMYVDRSGEGDVRRCDVAAPRPAAPEDRLPPGLPDLQDFSFAGYFSTEYGRVERWTRTVAGGAGQLGAARGEALTFRHEAVVARAPDNSSATPLRYSVSVDSSVLGPACDGYTHRYLELREQPHDPATFTVDPAEACEELRRDAPRHRAEPLREYTLPHRDPRYDAVYRRFKAEHGRRYLDDAEQSVRKTVLVQNSRFVDSGNRQGPTFNMEINHLGDRLDAEAARLAGVREQPEVLGAEDFPHSREQLAATRHTLPRAFDWRDRGGVTHVRNQGSCSSCWAFAVTGAVEGALFVRTRRLVALSEQSLLDCSRPYGGHGCGGTWPSAAYDYTQERGLPALADYTAYQARVLACREAQVPPVTRITAHVNVTANNVQALKVAIRRHAPTVVLIDSTTKSFQFYKKGVYYDDRCPKNKAEHAVLAVGWGERRRETHVVVKNSWSARWGEAGYARLQAAANTCGVLHRPSYPRLERPDVLHVPDTEEQAAAAADQ